MLHSMLIYHIIPSFIKLPVFIRMTAVHNQSVLIKPALQATCEFIHIPIDLPYLGDSSWEDKMKLQCLVKKLPKVHRCFHHDLCDVQIDLFH